MISEGGVEGDGDGVGEVEGADGGELDGDVALLVWVAVEEFVGEAVGFAAKEEVVAGLVCDMGVVELSGGGEEPAASVGEGGFVGGEGGVDGEVDGFPVVESGAAELLFG